MSDVIQQWSHFKFYMTKFSQVQIFCLSFVDLETNFCTIKLLLNISSFSKSDLHTHIPAKTCVILILMQRLKLFIFKNIFWYVTHQNVQKS